MSMSRPIVVDEKAIDQNVHVQTSYDENTTYQIKAQLHCHTNDGGDDGADTPTELEEAYKDAGFGYCAITGHNKLTTDPVVADILHGEGAEESGWFGHLTAVGITATQSSQSPQGIIEDIHDDGGFVIIAHMANGSEPWKEETLYATNDFDCIEVYNGWSIDGNYEPNIDELLTMGVRFFLTAVDDCHEVASMIDGAKAGRFGSAVYVNTDVNTAAGVEAAIKAGNFYASQGAGSTAGPTMSLSIGNGIITVSTPDESTIDFIKAGGATAQTTVTVTSETYTIQGDEQYVRVRVTRDSDSKMAWSNPIWVDVREDSKVKGGSPIPNRLRALGSIVDSSLVYHGQFFDGTAGDSSPYGNDFTLNNSATIEDGVLVLPGTNGHDASIEELLIDYDKPFTMACWVYHRDGPSSHTIIAAGAHAQWSILGGNRLCRFRSQSDDTSTGTSSAHYEEWQHWAVTYDGTNVRIYRNGVQAAIEEKNLIASTGEKTSIGSYTTDGSSPLKGGLMDVRIYQRWLAIDEIRSIVGFVPMRGLSGQTLMKITDDDSDVEAAFWYDKSENKIKYFNGTAVKTIAVE